MLIVYFLGADFVETNTFSATRIAQADYGLEDLVCLDSFFDY